jgi:hypothetical protein
MKLPNGFFMEFGIGVNAKVLWAKLILANIGLL